MPAVQIALEANGVGAELPCVEIVVRIPRRRPICGRLEREAKSQLLAPRARADESCIGLWAGARLGVIDRQVEPPAPAPDRYGSRPREALLTESTSATQGALGSRGRRGGGGGGA